MPGVPEVRLLSALPRGLTEPELRGWAASHPESARAEHASRSYRYPYALVAAHAGPVGVDIERVEAFDPAFVDSIRTPSEPSAAAGAGPPGEYPAALWCSKEALAKALGNPLRYDPRRLGSPLFWPDGRAGPWRAAALTAPAGYVAWLCWRPGPAGEPPRGPAPAP